METPKSPPGSVRRHGRNISVPMVRRSTVGPLDAADDPLVEPASAESPSITSTSEPTALTPSDGPQPPQQSLPEPATAQQYNANVDVRFLQDPNVYHRLNVDDIPSVFLKSKHQPPPETALSDLIQHGHFRRAAETALTELRQCSPSDAVHVLQLLYTRLACLVLLSRPDIASQEAVPLTELLSRNPPGAKDLLPVIPWELRLLLVRLQTVGAVDGGRRGIMALYALASEVRAHVREAQDEHDQMERDLWSARLRDLGLRVADSLVEMGELETAGRHLATLTDVDVDDIAVRKALLRVRVGDVTGARRSIQEVQSPQRKATLEALLKVADGDLSNAAEAWRQLAEDDPEYASFAQNLAVCMLYTGHIAEARRVLEDLAERLPAFPSLLLNLSTVYELCTKRAMERKTGLIHKMADKRPAPDSGGWEPAKYEFKI